MSDKYMPKVGEKVRATLGENVLVGSVQMVEEYPESFYVEIDVPPADTFGLSSADGWQFEQVVSVPTKFAAVIRRADGRRFTRVTVGEEYQSWAYENDQYFFDTTVVVRDGFTIEFEGLNS